MIGRLRGIVAVKRPPHLLLDVQGVGYELEAPMSTFFTLPEQGVETTLHTHLVVREDAHTLYAFGSETERALFRALIRISGVGPKLALTILSGMDVGQFTNAIQQADTVALSRLPGIGKKTAERLIVEMRDRLATLESSAGIRLSGTSVGDREPDPVGDALTALETLGYRNVEARKMVKAVACEGIASEEIIRRALQSVMKT